MTKIRQFDPLATRPDWAVVLQAQGIPQDAELPPRVRDLVDEALASYSRLARPIGMWSELSTKEFEAVFSGERQNAARTPLGEIVPDAQALALFAVTIGPEICQEIGRRFDAGDPASGFALDTTASAGAERLAGLLAAEFMTELEQRDSSNRNLRALPYSPGYCGWHVSGQRRLFAALAPERIGITLNESCLMSPIKSVSGVLVAGDEACHSFEIGFDFCTTCTDQSCRDRLQTAFPR